MIEIKGISFSYGKTKILDNISFQVREGECVGILGNNGVGKSTLITCLNKIRIPKSGSLFINEVNIEGMNRVEIARNISYVAQKNEISQMTVFDSVILGRKPYIKWSLSQRDIDLCDEMINKVGLSDFKLRLMNELSGGELQKVMLARALVQEPKLLLLDEPTSNLDPKNQHETMALVKTIAKEKNISVLIVIHDLSLALRYCDKFLFLSNGEVYKYGDESIITNKTIEDVYGISSDVVVLNGRKVVVIN